ncbi:GNAT family N-acetyltransferase [Porphyrobacter sp. TH134]|uniref:GNAT family N-acetyltransferase n=1 Tax=Porphyrobacter sp. TH134 TaxID=2067450 RepID=UPI000C7E3658|nr:GNAT family N-acetyltransferase [Porphyrobacter sp. TH134]PLK24577.1 GNAT family N-acetyltransferase [Porphyrobacter sp. TH134]
MDVSIRIATSDDVPAMARLIERSVADLQRDFLSPAEIAASRVFMSIDSQLLRDQTYFCAVADGQIAGCGGWSWRRTLFGGDGAGELINPEPLDPLTEPARIRAMYTDPAFVRRGVGLAIITAAEAAARAAGFRETELMSTLAGEPLYRRCGYHAAGPRVYHADVPLIPMRKRL